MYPKKCIDQLGNEVYLKQRPIRIVSLVPSQTELLFDLGLSESIVGITHFCIHPKDLVKQKRKIGGTKKIDMQIIDELNPDIIIGNKEENEKEQIEYLQEKYPVWMSDINDLPEALDMIWQLGELFDREYTANNLCVEIHSAFATLEAPVEKKKVLYFIWKDPYMVVGKETFINAILQSGGLENVCRQKRYPILEASEIESLNPNWVFLSSEPYPFAEKHLSYFEKLCPNSRVKIVDGELFSWYGSRLRYVPAYFKTLFADIK